MRTQKSRFLLEHQADILNNTEGVVMDKQNKPNFLRLPWIWFIVTLLELFPNFCLQGSELPPLKKIK